MKLRIPDGCGAVSHLGQSLEIAEDQSIEVDDAAWPVLSAHGFRPWEDQPEAEISEMTREQLVTAVMNATAKALRTIGTEEIRARLIAFEASAPSLDESADAAQPTTSIDAEALSALNRNELFAFLKGKGVAVSLPITKEGLRALARQTLGLT